MDRSLALVSFLVRDYDEALAFFREKLGFSLAEDQEMGGGKRWVVMSPAATGGTSLLLARAATPEQEAAVGRQAGGRVFLFLHTSDFWSDYRRMRSLGVQFVEEPRQEPYGTVAVFRDLYGNRWDLVEPRGGGKK